MVGNYIMDLITSSTMNLMKLGMDGLLARHQAISSNIANVMTPNYHRQEVSFESQLNQMREEDKNKKMLKEFNSITFDTNPVIDNSPQKLTKEGYNILTPEQKAFLDSSSFQGFKPQILSDEYSGTNTDGNNVELEREMMDLSKTGTQYTLLSTLERRAYSKISTAIRGE